MQATPNDGDFSDGAEQRRQRSAGRVFPVRTAIAIMGGSAVVAASSFMLLTHSLRRQLRSELPQQ